MEFAEYLGSLALLAIAAFLVVLVLLLMVTIINLSRVKIYDLPDEKIREAVACVLRARPDLSEWTKTYQCEYLGMWHLQAPLVNLVFVVWKIPNLPMYLGAQIVSTKQLDLVIAKKIHAIFISSLENDLGVSTSSTRDALFFPQRPGLFVQADSTRSLDSLFEWHKESVEYVSGLSHSKPKAIPVSFREVIEESVQKEARHVRTRTLWPLRIPYWVFVRKYLLHKKPISEQDITIPEPTEIERPDWSEEQQANPFSSPHND